MKNTNQRKDLQLQRAKLRFGNSAVHRFTSMLMNDGKKDATSKILLRSLATCKFKIFSARATHTLRSKVSVAPQAGKNLLAASKGTLGLQLGKDRSLQSSQICEETVHNVEPIVETRKVRVRGSTYQVPSISHSGRRERIAVHWILNTSESKKRSSQLMFSPCLGQELFDSLDKTGLSRIKTDQMYKLASHSRAYARYRWW